MLPLGFGVKALKINQTMVFKKLQFQQIKHLTHRPHLFIDGGD